MAEKLINFPCVVFFLTLALVSFGNAQPQYPETISVLQSAYNNEIEACQNYLAYAKRATSEKYPNLSYLFVSFAASEAIHAQNFKQILLDLGIKAKEPPDLKVKISGTRINLKEALEFEMLDIDQRYPQLIEKAKRENYLPALRHLNFSWEAEKQHREIIQKMQSGTGIFFGLLSKKIEETSVHYLVCQTCGSTTVELPSQVCPICKNPVSQYKMVERLK